MNKPLIKAMVVEDEEGALNLLSELLEANGLATVVAATTDPFEAVDMIFQYEPDIVFLDIRMPGKSGFDILNDLHSSGSYIPYIVFTTAHDKYAIKAFDYAAFDYLLKPIDPDRLRETLHRFMSSGRKRTEAEEKLLKDDKVLTYRGTTGISFIDTDDVVYISADGNYSNFHFITGRIETVTTLLGTVEMHLGKQFFRIGRSCIINISYLTRIDTKQLQCIFIKDKKEFRCEISRDKIKQLIEYMKQI